MISNGNLEGKENELMKTFTSNSASLANNSKFETGYYKKAFQFSPTPTDTSLDEHTDKNVNETAVESSHKESIFKKMKYFLKKVAPQKRNYFSYKKL
ncbi:hypothetical protein TNCV_1282151 [Trichonephila clavipes]|uniref:Uncharacterized protein n=1 Tax=Trichonephila clavipes TaxID=2585209 RepID=A0A8X6SUJ5_TRICX|nr:hypothetical protein TNCV_1282151 [Trichonephila clavipes]